MKRSIKVIVAWLALTVLSAGMVVVSGCSEPAPEPQAAPAPKQRVKSESKPKRAEAAAEEEKKEEEAKVYSYDPTGKRNPFDIPEKPEVDCTPPTCYDLEQMRIDAIMWGSGMEAAHIILPSGEDIMVEEGDELGINHGRVKYIGDRQIVVEEIYVDPLKPAEIHIIEKILKLNAKIF